MQLKYASFILELAESDKMGSLSVNPIVPMPKNGSVKLVIDTRYLTSVLHPTSYTWLKEPVEKIMTRVNGEIFPVSVLFGTNH